MNNIEELHNFLLNRGWKFVQMGAIAPVVDHKRWHLKTYLPHEEDERAPDLIIEYIKECLDYDNVEFMEMEVAGEREGVLYRFRAYHLDPQMIMDNYYTLITNLSAAYRQIYEIWT